MLHRNMVPCALFSVLVLFLSLGMSVRSGTDFRPLSDTELGIAVGQGTANPCCGGPPIKESYCEKDPEACENSTKDGTVSIGIVSFPVTVPTGCVKGSLYISGCPLTNGSYRGEGDGTAIKNQQSNCPPGTFTRCQCKPVSIISIPVQEDGQWVNVDLPGLKICLINWKQCSKPYCGSMKNVSLSCGLASPQS